MVVIAGAGAVAVPEPAVIVSVLENVSIEADCSQSFTYQPSSVTVGHCGEDGGSHSSRRTRAGGSSFGLRNG